MCLGRREGRGGFGPMASVVLKDVPRGQGQMLLFPPCTEDKHTLAPMGEGGN